MKNDENSGNAKERLLEKAEELFAEKGYHAVTVREITAAANCNMGAVNYYFTSKKQLYMEVFHSRWVPRELKMYESFKQSLVSPDSLSPESVIQSLAVAYLEAPLTAEELSTHRRLIVMEINNPTEVFEYAADNTLRPLFKCVQEHLAPFLPDHLDEESLTLDILGIFGMLLYFNYSRPMVSRLTGKGYDAAFKSRLINHLVQFSLDGLGLN